MTSKINFKGVDFPINPSKLKLSHSRNTVQITSPFGNSHLQDIGINPTVIYGVGRLVGDDVIEQYDSLKSLIASSNSGVLFIPNMRPIFALFKSLDITRLPSSNMIDFEFVFVEDLSQTEVL